MGLLTSALDRVPSSGSLKYSQLGPSSIQRIYVAFAANKDVCLTLLQRCVDYGVKLIGLPSVALPTSLRVMTSQDLWERTMRLRSEMIGVSMEKAVSVQGLSSYHVTPFDGISPTQVFIRLGKVQYVIQQGPVFRTEGDFRVEHLAGETLVLAHGYK
ncbi:hypothetical protein DFH94DRAFT_184014 [Russula ochroleuca]|uniref:Uncharacterized protein n=1 Tax=Russula ochroleuca TaxID=152965 RepID=A0A9P5N541_9AGAM|nr:hypothetical protein DFH94DRAFT_184014 [Russula ochroleuca]